jgi:uncharacterized membrane protein (UPF0127 family)
VLRRLVSIVPPQYAAYPGSEAKEKRVVLLRRIFLVVAVATLVVAMIAAAALPTLAQEGLAPQAIMTITNSAGERLEAPVEIAATDVERERGLMGRTALAQDAGMLFVFDQEQQLSFWMKDTLIPLSIAYIDTGGRIVDIQDMQPLDETPHPSTEPARYALEVNQGFFAARGIQIGDRVELPV